MKGSYEKPTCKFSYLAAAILKHYSKIIVLFQLIYKEIQPNQVHDVNVLENRC